MHSFFKPASGSGDGKKSSLTKSDNETENLKPWIEKYRPKCVDDIAHQDEVVAVLKKCITGADLPNMLFYGPPGTGKTSTILALSRDLYGPKFRDRVLELNASDDRGISVVRDKIKNFAQLSVSSLQGGKSPSFKIIILDEADSMTKAAQQALRRTMEKQTKTTRFCLICNYVTRIIAPITSRCSKFRFKPLSEEDQKKRLLRVAETESVKISEDAMDSMVKCSEGDLRKAMTFLQTAHRLKGDEGIAIEDVLEITGVIPDPVIKSFLNSCSSNSYENLLKTVQEISADGHAAAQLVSQLHDEIVIMPSLTDEQKCAITEKLATLDYCLNDGADEYLQLMSLGTLIQQQICS
ncbi:replication factor C subunit 4-like [Styela clava]